MQPCRVDYVSRLTGQQNKPGSTVSEEDTHLEKKLEVKKLRLQKETIREITPKDLTRIIGGEPENQCYCTTDFSNACCGPNGSC